MFSSWGQEVPLTQAQSSDFKAKAIERNQAIKTMQADFKQRKTSGIYV